MTGRDGASTEVQRQREPTAGNTPLCPTHGLEVDRQTFIKRALALTLGSAPVAVLLAACGGRAGDGMGEGVGDGMMDGGMPDWMMSHGGMSPRIRGHTRVIHRLLSPTRYVPTCAR